MDRLGKGGGGKWKGKEEKARKGGKEIGKKRRNRKRKGGRAKVKGGGLDYN
jgi:hypothetical protein